APPGAPPWRVRGAQRALVAESLDQWGFDDWAWGTPELMSFLRRADYERCELLVARAPDSPEGDPDAVVGAIIPPRARHFAVESALRSADIAGNCRADGRSRAVRGTWANAVHRAAGAAAARVVGRGIVLRCPDDQVRRRPSSSTRPHHRDSCSRASTRRPTSRRSSALGPSCVYGAARTCPRRRSRSEEHTSELQSRENLVCRLLL